MRKTTYALLCLLTIDIVFMVLHVSFSRGLLQDVNFAITTDGGYGEIFQYCKFISAALLLAYLARSTRSEVFGLWSVLAFLLFLDDWLRLHERLGGKVLVKIVKPVMASSYEQGQPSMVSLPLSGSAWWDIIFGASRRSLPRC